MPPMRTLSLDKPVKTERTHEENQERAYIAASRRSDRSLEARVESARRASEIHKRRTGRSLRITEQDVVNEEMYEEEDDDLPLQYRRLTAHLQTNSTDFNRRLAAYLTSQMAMRTALDQAMLSSYGPPANGGSYMSTQPRPYGSSSVGSPTSPTSPFTYRQSPYPIPEPQSYRPTRQQSPPSAPDASSLSSLVSKPISSSNLESQAEFSPSAISIGKQSSPQPSIQIPASRQNEPYHQENQNDTSTAAESTQYKQFGQLAFNPLTTVLPPESQMFLPPRFMSSEKVPHDIQSYNSSLGFGGLTHFHPSYDGMSQTLAPGALDSNTDGPLSSLTDGVLTPFSAANNFNLDPDYPDELEANEPLFPHSPLNNVSGQSSPGERDWSNYIDTSWD